jgi:hypothetical protein
MRLYHATPMSNVQSILENGVLESKGAIKTIWVHGIRAREWALEHVSRRHGVPKHEIVFFAFNLDTRRLTRTNQRCVWHTGGRDLETFQIRNVVQEAAVQ